MDASYDIAIIGAGIAGASLAAALGGATRVVLLEAEDQPGYHATGRSAAFWTESYGGASVQPLTSASGPWLAGHGFLSPRGALTIARTGQEAALAEWAGGFAARGVAIELLGREAVAARISGLKAEWTCGAWEPDCSDIDVAALHQHYLATARGSGAQLWTRARLDNATREGELWHLELGDKRSLQASVVVNAAGAWADEVALACGVRPLGIAPMRRTVAQVRVSPEVAPDLPLVLDFNEQFYFKPEGPRLWLSPHDETASAPCDAAAEDIDVATAIARLGEVVDWSVERVEHRWAGLRSFTPDRLPAYGFDSREPGFFWFAGQGGFGIQTAPAGAALAAALLTGSATASTIDSKAFDPARFG